jgi:hypothetical protein
MSDPFYKKLLAIAVAAGVIALAYTVPALTPAREALLALASFAMGAVGVKSEGMKASGAGPAALALVLGASLTLTGCPLEMSPAQTAAGVQTAQCERFLAVFKDGHAKGYTCDQARRDAQKAEPMCVLSFECPGDDLGDE